MALAQPTYEELQDELAKLRRLYQGACREARLEQLRADRAESQLGMAQPQPTNEELHKENAKLRKLFEGACLEARSAQLRAEYAENKLEDKSRVREDAERALEKEKMEELENRERAHQREMEKLRGENGKLKVEIDDLRKRLEKKDNAETHLNSSIHPPDTSDLTVPENLSDNFSIVATFTRPDPKAKKEEQIVPEEVNEDNQNEARDSMDEQLPMDDHEVPNDDVFAEDSIPTVAEMDSVNDFAGIEDMDGTAPFETEENRLESMDPSEGEEEIEATMENAMDTPETVKVEKRKRSSRNVSRPVQYNESIDDSNGDSEPSLKKSRSDSTRKNDNKRRSLNGDDDKSGDVCKKSGLSKVNGTELECPQCEYRTQNVTTWITHLRRSHSTNPALAGLALLCECGDESLSHNHSRACDGNTTVIRKRDGPIRRLNDEKATPQCVLCEMYPKTALGYARHLQIHHKSTLSQNGIYLMCSCALELRSNDGRLKHLEECDPRQFTLHKLDDE